MTVLIILTVEDIQSSIFLVFILWIIYSLIKRVINFLVRQVRRLFESKKNKNVKSDLKFIFAMMGFMENVFSSFYFIKHIFVSDNLAEKQVEMSWYQLIWMKFLDILLTVWQYRLAFIRDIILIIVAVMMLYLLWTITKKQTSSENSNGSTCTLTIYNNTMSIHLCLNELNEFINNIQIYHDTISISNLFINLFFYNCYLLGRNNQLKNILVFQILKLQVIEDIIQIIKALHQLLLDSTKKLNMSLK